MNTPATVSAAIVAGGRANRFGGRDKSRLLVEGRSIIVRQLEVLQQLTVDVIVIANDLDRFADLPVRVEPDLVPDAGPLGGIYTALSVSRASRVVIVAGDLPFLNAALLTTLSERSEGADGCWVRTARGIEPLLACYQRAVAPVLFERLTAGALKLADLEAVLRMEALDEAELARFGPIDRLLANVNTPEDYARVQYPPS